MANVVYLFSSSHHCDSIYHCWHVITTHFVKTKRPKLVRISYFSCALFNINKTILVVTFYPIYFFFTLSFCILSVITRVEVTPEISHPDIVALFAKYISFSILPAGKTDEYKTT